MTKEELKDIIIAVIEKLQEDEEAPQPACIFGDTPCDVTTRYAVGEES